MLIRSIKLTNFLSFGPNAQELELGPLNVLIGPNGSGKSNLIEAIGLLQAAPREIAAPIHEVGLASDWIWKGEPKAPFARVEAIVKGAEEYSRDLRYGFCFAVRSQQFMLTEEYIWDDKTCTGPERPFVYFDRQDARTELKSWDGQKYQSNDPGVLDLTKSILAQRKDPNSYPELTHLGEIFDRIRFYREWTIGRNAPPRSPYYTDMPVKFLDEDSKNLGIVLNNLKLMPAAKDHILKILPTLYGDIADYEIQIVGGMAQLFLREGDIMLPATRLSDGTLRFLSLLAILCHPEPPPLVCIEEPEIGLHPDILLPLAELLREASQRCQLIVTTHSDALVDALTDTPESVVVCEKHDGATEMRRLNKENLSHWLDRYTLGELWVKGELGGNRW